MFVLQQLAHQDAIAILTISMCFGGVTDKGQESESALE